MGKNLSSGGFRRAFMSGVCASVCVSVSFMSSGALASYSPVSDFSDGPVLHLTHPHVITHIYRPSEALEAGAGRPRGRKLAVSCSGAELALRAPRAGGEIGFISSLSNFPFSLPLSRGSRRGYESSEEAPSEYKRLAALVIPTFNSDYILSEGVVRTEQKESIIESYPSQPPLLRGGEKSALLREREARKFLASGRGTEKFSISGDEEKIREKEVRVASVCFITDAGSCSSNGFGNTEENGGSGNPGGDPDYGTPEELCRDAGFVNTPCPEGAFPDSYCPYDASYHSSCECSAEYNQVCDGAGEQGVGSACGGKYKECCSLCEGYDETSVPAGYVSAGECDSCSGKKYKIKCDPSKYVSASVCGANGGTGSSCSDDAGVHYTECKCPAGYEWSESSQSCGCSSSYRYSCQGSGYAGGEGQSCDDRYAKCKCAEGYVWDAAQGACVCKGTDFCVVNQNCGALGYAQKSCAGKALKCPFDTNYVFCL